MSTVVDMVSFFMADQVIVSMIGTRLYPITLPQEPTFPAVTYFRVDRPHEHTQDGHELVWPKFQFDFYASTYAACEALVKAFQSSIDNWITAFGNPAFDEDIRDMPEPDLPPVGQRFRKTMDITFWGLE